MNIRLRRAALILVVLAMVCFGDVVRSASPAYAKAPVAVGFVTGGYATQASLDGSIPLQGAVQDNTFTCAVAKTCDTPTGTVDFLLKGAGGTQTLASLSLVPVAKDHKLAETAKTSAAVTLPAGSYTLTAHYLGDGNFNANHYSMSFTVTKESPKAVLTQNSTSTSKGQSVMFTALLGGYAHSLSPTGTVRFYDNGHSLGAVGVLPGSSLLSAHGSLTTTVLQGGAHTITASYSGDANYNLASSPAVHHSVKYYINPCALSLCSTSTAPANTTSTCSGSGGQGNAAGDCGVGSPSSGPVSTASGTSAGSNSGSGGGQNGGGTNGGGTNGGGTNGGGAVGDPGAAGTNPGATAGSGPTGTGVFAAGSAAGTNAAGSAAAAGPVDPQATSGSHFALWLVVAIVILLIVALALFLARRRREMTR